MSEVNKWYSGKSVLITGSTGFVGKCLVEKLLRDCHEIRDIYLIIRSKHKKSFEERTTTYLDHYLFEKIIKSNPNLKEKIHFIKGDIAPQLHLSNEDIKRICENISIIFHCAADVRFDRSLNEAYESNVIGTINILRLASKANSLEAFVYVSTSFSQTNDKVIDEQLYAPKVPLNILHKIITETDKELLKIITPHVLDKFPNAYGFTKNLCEQTVYGYRNQFPVIIARPSIVSSIMKDPISGYTEGIHGINGWGLAGGYGVLRSMICRVEQQCNAMPADVVVNALIVIAYKCGMQNKENYNFVDVINIAVPAERAITWECHIETLRKYAKMYPFNITLWVPNVTVETSKVKHFINVLLFQLLPAILIDGILIILRMKNIMLRVQRKIYLGLESLNYYTNNEFIFKTNKFDEMMMSLNSIDRNTYYNTEGMNNDEYCKTSVRACKIYLVKEKLEDIPRARRLLITFKVFDMFFKGLFYVWLISRILKYFNVEIF